MYFMILMTIGFIITTFATSKTQKKVVLSLRQLLEKTGVDEIKYFQTRSEPVLSEMLMCLSSTIVEDVVLKIKNSKGYGLLTDEVTGISSICQLVIFRLVKWSDPTFASMIEPSKMSDSSSMHVSYL